MLSNVVSMGNKEVDHALCRLCPHDESCSHVCMAIECLVQISLETSLTKKFEMLDNAADQLDLENSIKSPATS